MANPPTLASLANQIASLNQQVSALQAQVNSNAGAATSALSQISKLSSTSTTSSSTTSTGISWTEVNPATLLFTSTGASVSWTTLSFSNVPQGAVRVVLNGWGDLAQPNNNNVQLNFRKDSSSVTRIAMTSHSVSGNYSVTEAFTVEVPLSASNTIDYEIVNGYFTTLNVYLIEYVIG